MAEIFWTSGLLRVACAFVFLNSNIVDYELKTTAVCRECGMEIRISTEKEFSIIVIDVTQEGKEDTVHVKRRRFTKAIRAEVGLELENTAPSVYRSKKSKELMVAGEVIPAILANKGKNLRIY